MPLLLFLAIKLLIGFYQVFNITKKHFSVIYLIILLVRLKYTSFDIGFFPNYLIWVLSGVGLSLISAFCVREISPHSAGAGVAEMKSILSGLILHQYLSIPCLFSKMIGIVCVQAGSLSVGMLFLFWIRITFIRKSWSICAH